jgi:glycerol uptake facilitator-like aquaporin
MDVGLVSAALELTNHHRSHGTTTESVINPARAVGTESSHLAELLTEGELPAAQLF